MSVQIVRTDEETGEFSLSIETLERLLLQEDVRDREVVVIAIAGGFRKGKSFLLNFFLKHLNEHVINYKISIELS